MKQGTCRPALSIALPSAVEVGFVVGMMPAITPTGVKVDEIVGGLAFEVKTYVKYIGDAVMALFGAPVAHEDDPERAVRAAFAIRDFAVEEGLELRVGVTTGEALVSSLDLKGAPTVVQRNLIRPPMSRLGPAPDADRAVVQAQSPVALKYDTVIDRESAYEILTGREAQAAKEKDALKRAEAAEAEAPTTEAPAATDEATPAE